MTRIDPPLVVLHVLVPTAVENRLIDWLLALDQPGVEFSVHPVAARGPLVHLAANDERVQGCAHRKEFKLILTRETLQAIEDEMLALLAGVDGGWWVMPVERFGAFARVPEVVAPEVMA